MDKLDLVISRLLCRRKSAMLGLSIHVSRPKLELDFQNTWIQSVLSLPRVYLLIVGHSGLK